MSDTAVQQGEARMLIDGELVEAESGRRYDNVNPATEKVLGTTADASVDDAHRAVAAARRAFDQTDWSTDRELRKRCLLQLQDALESEVEELRLELVAEVGCPMLGTYGPQLDAPLTDGIRWPVSMIDEFPWERQLPDGNVFSRPSWRKVTKEAIGVVGAITPWNYPFEITIHKVAQALVAGNTVVLKPAPDTPWNATRWGRLVAEKTDIPPGVFNVVTSSDNLVGEALVTDPRVDMISFTGSTATGRRIMEKGASTLKRLFLELGGKSAHIVLDDADFGPAMEYSSGICFHAGQACATSSRVLVPRARQDEAIELLKENMSAFRVGDPMDLEVLTGPVINRRQRERVLGYIEKGVSEGARLELGGGTPPNLPKGFFVEPTLFADVDNSSTIAQEEIFGPVLCVIPFDSEEEAIAIANDSSYGLSGTVTSSDEEHAITVASKIRSGTISVNGGVFYGPDAPFGGYKASGIGRQNGLEGFEQHTETRTWCGLLPSADAG